MKPLKLRDAQDITHIRDMTVDEASRFASRYQPSQITHNQVVALSLVTWHNTREDWPRLQACLVLLRQRPRRRAW